MANIRLNRKLLLTRVLPALIVLLVILGVVIVNSGKKEAVEEVEKKPKEEKKIELPVMCNMNTEASADEVCKVLQDAGLGNVDVFRKWVLDFGQSAGDDASLSSEWIEPNSQEFDLYECMHGWDKNHDYTDSSSRMAAFLLMQGSVTADNPDTYYNGTYLQADIDAVEGTKQYDMIKKDQELFNTIFGEEYMYWGQELDSMYTKVWEEKGIQVNNDRASLLCITLLDETSREMFIGHAGVLVKTEEGYLFVEKLTAQQPYQAFRIKDMDELIEIFSQRTEYFGQEGSEGESPAVFVNGEFVSKLKQP